MYTPAASDSYVFSSLCLSGALATGEDWVVLTGVCKKQRIPNMGALSLFRALLSAAVCGADVKFSVWVQHDCLMFSDSLYYPVSKTLHTSL